jgi:hypothetical protein
MRKENTTYIFVFFILMALASCKVDNYKGPNAAIYGTVINSITNKPLQTEQPNGTRISMTQIDYSNKRIANFFWGKANGTFENAKVFSGTYLVVPVNGPFFPADTQKVQIRGRTNVDFKVIPYLTIMVQDSASNSSNGVTTRYSITRSQTGGNISKCGTIVSLSSHVSHAVNNKSLSVIHDLTNVPDNTILSTQFADTLHGLKSGKTYYIRVEAITNGSNGQYNYSPVMKLKIP